MRIERKQIPKLVMIDLLKDICGCLALFLFLAGVVLLTPCDARAASEGVSYTPVIRLECNERDTYSELRELLPPWAFKGLEIVAHYSDNRQLWSAQDGGDCGNFGPFHLQGPDPFDLGVISRTDCPWADDAEWRDWMVAFGYSEYSARLQAAAWLDIVGPVVSDASAERLDLTEGEMAGIAAMSNSSPARTRTWGRQHGWNLELMLAEYLDFHNHSATKLRRVARIRSHLWQYDL